MSSRQVYLVNKLGSFQGLLKWSAGIAAGLITYQFVGDGVDSESEFVQWGFYGILVAACSCVLGSSALVLHTLRQLNIDSDEVDAKIFSKLKVKSKVSVKIVQTRNFVSFAELNFEHEMETEDQVKDENKS